MNSLVPSLDIHTDDQNISDKEWVAIIEKLLIDLATVKESIINEFRSLIGSEN
jgi:hypothetical protein